MGNDLTAPGKGLLKTVGIVMILFGLAFLGLLGSNLAFGLAGQLDWHIAFLMCGAGLGGFMQFFAGIVGVRNCGKLSRAITCIVWGVIAMTFSTIGLIFGLIYEMEQSWSTLQENRNIYALLIVLPVLYLIGAVQNWNAAKRLI